MRKLMFALVALCALALPALAQTTDAKAAEILKKARAAIGDEGKLKNLQGLSITGTSRATMGDRQMESELAIDVMTPDKVMKMSSMQFGTTTTVLNGAQQWNEFVPAVGVGGPGGGGPRFGGPGGPGGGNPAMRDFMQQQQHRELLQILISFLLTAPEADQVQYTFVGEAPGPEGSKLNVLDGKGANNFAVRLYLDQESNRLIGLSYKAKSMAGMRRGGPGGPGGGAPGQPRAQGQAGTGAQGGQAAPAAPATGTGQSGQTAQAGQQGQRPQRTPEEIEKRMKEMEEALAKAPEQDYRWAFNDYKSVSGINFPHRITKMEAGKPTEEWEISKIKVNPKLSADKFVKKEKDKAQNQ